MTDYSIGANFKIATQKVIRCMGGVCVKDLTIVARQEELDNSDNQVIHPPRSTDDDLIE